MSEEVSMDFPYLETDKKYHATDSLKVVLVKKQPTLKIEKGVLEKSIMPELKGKQSRKREDAEVLKVKLKAGKLTLGELTQYVIRYL